MTGNTEAVAKCMAEGLSGEDVTIMPAKDVNPASLSSYDLVFLGSGVYAASVGKSIKNLMKNAAELPSKFVFFYTHASQEPSGHAKCFYRIEKQLIKKNLTVYDRFECLGDTKPTKEQMEAMTPEQKEQYLKNLKGHPNAKDLEDAKKFAKNAVQEILLIFVGHS